MRVPRHPAARRSGLSLLEVLLSLAIFLLSLIALGQLVSFGSERARDVQYLSIASVKAQSKLNEVIAGSLPMNGTGETTFDDDTDWSWSLTADADAAVDRLDRRVRHHRQHDDQHGDERDFQECESAARHGWVRRGPARGGGRAAPGQGCGQPISSSRSAGLAGRA